MIDAIDELFRLFSDAIDDVSFNPDLICDDEMGDICDELPADSEEETLNGKTSI